MGMAGAMASMSFYPDGSFRDGQGLRKKFSQAAATAAAASNDEEEAGAAASAGRWFWTPSMWVWGQTLEKAIQDYVNGGWLQIDKEFLDWWSATSGSTQADSHSNGSVRKNNQGVQKTVDFGGSDDGSKGEEACSSNQSDAIPGVKKKPNTGKDYVPGYDGTTPLREYERRVLLFRSTTGIDKEFQGGKLVEKLTGDAWEATESLDLGSLRCPEGPDLLIAHLKKCWNP